jgi:RHS repeat-associated protein
LKMGFLEQRELIRILGNVNGQALQTPYLDPNGYNQYLQVVAAYAYDSDSKLTNLSYPGQLALSSSHGSPAAGTGYQYTYDVAGRATGLNQWDSVNEAWDTVTSNGTYTAAGQVTGWQEGGINLARSYDPARGWLNNLTAASSMTSYLSLQYSYNSNGQATTVTDSVNPGQAVTSYTYDNLDRLSTATTPNRSLSWTYDGFGNRTSQSGSAASGQPTPPSSSLSYNASNQITTSGYVYDANGNLTQMPGIPGMTYDVFDRLSYYYTSSASALVSYDAFGRRIGKSLPGNQERIYFYDPSGRLLAEYDMSLNATYSNTGSEMAAPSRATQYFAGQRVGQWTDRVGSKRADGGSSSQYYPYGEEITSTNNDTFKFARLYRDSDSGLDYARNRFYAAAIGRFLNPDPKGQSARAGSPQSWNRYAYVTDNPAGLSDPSGLDGCDQDQKDCETTDCNADASCQNETGSGDGSSGGGGCTGECVTSTVSFPSGTAGCPAGQSAAPGGQCDLPIYGPNGNGQAIINQINENNPQGAVNGAAAVIVGGAAIGVAMATPALVAAGAVAATAVVNLGGEGEVAGAINVQGPWILQGGWFSSQTGQSLTQLQAAGNQFVISSSTNLPFANGSVQTFIKNNVPVDQVSYWGPGYSSAAIWQMLTASGQWINNGSVVPRP